MREDQKNLFIAMGLSLLVIVGWNYFYGVPEAQRQPACVITCPVGARHFGDLGDPESAVSQLVASRGGFDLMPEMGYAPTNKYLPPRRPMAPNPNPPAEAEPTTLDIKHPLMRWLDRALSR